MTQCVTQANLQCCNRANYESVIAEAIGRRDLQRQPQWTESIAVGSESFVKAVAAETHNRVELSVEPCGGASWTVRETVNAYGSFCQAENGSKARKGAVE